MKKTILALLSAALLLTACNKKESNTPDNPPVTPKPTITITVTRTASNDIEFTTECTDPSVTYYVYGMTKAKYDVESTFSEDSIMGFEISWFSFAAPEGKTWYEAMLAECVTGKKSYKFTDFTSIIEPETDLVIYAYGIDSVGRRTTYICTKNVTTAAMNLSQNQISVNITATYSNGIDADFTTTNNDSYYISLQRKTYVEYFQSEGHTLGEMASDLLIDDLTITGFIPLQSGDHTITPEEYSCRAADTDYYLIYFAYDAENGRRSEVNLVPFKTASK